MKNTFFKMGLFLAVGLTSTVFYACKKESDDGNIGGNASKIIATGVINSSTQIATVKAEVDWETNSDYGSDVIAQAQYQNTGFTLELPATLPAKYLEPLFGEEDFPHDVTVSDRTVKGTGVEIGAYDINENNIGGFYLIDGANEDEPDGVNWVYVDKNVTIKGEEREIDEEENEEYIGKYDMNLKKGWNVVYGKWTESHSNSTGRDVYAYTLTSKKPSGANYFWYFSYNRIYSYDYSSAKVGTKFVAKKKLFLQNWKSEK